MVGHLLRRIRISCVHTLHLDSVILCIFTMLPNVAADVQELQIVA